MAILNIGSLTANVYVTHVRCHEYQFSALSVYYILLLIHVLLSLCIGFSCMQSTAETRILIYLTEWFRPGSCSSSFGTGYSYTYNMSSYLFTVVYICMFFSGERHLSSVGVSDVCSNTLPYLKYQTAFLTIECFLNTVKFHCDVKLCNWWQCFFIILATLLPEQMWWF